MDDKRLHIVVNDEQSIKWLEAQNNMSASIRLLIQQVANGDTSFEDYILYCAKQAPSPFVKDNQKEKPTVEPTIEVDEPMKEEEEEEVKSVPEPELDVEPETKEEEPRETEEELEPEKIQEQPEEKEDKSEEENTSIDWDEQEAQHENRIERMMRDLPNRE